MGYVYKITNTVNQKSYIGISIHEPEKRRIKDHLSGKGGGNRLVARAVKKYGRDAFTYEILEANVFDEFLPDLEVEYIAKFNTVAPNGYNLTSGGEVAKTFSDETRRRLSEKQKGEKNSFFGKKHTIEARCKMSEARKKQSAETRRKISEARLRKLKGKPLTPGHRLKISEARKGKTHTKESKRKMSEARKGTKLSIETRRKMSESLRHPDYMLAKQYFFSLPNNMPLRTKRKSLLTSFPNVSQNSLNRWVRKWVSN